MLVSTFESRTCTSKLMPSRRSAKARLSALSFEEHLQSFEHFGCFET